MRNFTVASSRFIIIIIITFAFGTIHTKARSQHWELLPLLLAISVRVLSHLTKEPLTRAERRGALSFCIEIPVVPMGQQMEQSFLVEISQKKRNTFSGFLFSNFLEGCIAFHATRCSGVTVVLLKAKHQHP